MAPSPAELVAIKLRFYEAGLTVIKWARDNDFDVNLVYGVLSGRSRARRGESHRIAVALGLKDVEEPLSSNLLPIDKRNAHLHQKK